MCRFAGIYQLASFSTYLPTAMYVTFSSSAPSLQNSLAMSYTGAALTFPLVLC